MYGVLKRGGMGGVGGGKEQWTVVGIKMNEKIFIIKKLANKQTRNYLLRIDLIGVVGTCSKSHVHHRGLINTEI